MDKYDLLEKLREYGYSGKIIEAFDKVDRADFVPDDKRAFAYEDRALPIGHGQTISQPQTIAFMLEKLEIGSPGQKILEVGCGSGYVLALISHICPECDIQGTEIVQELADQAGERMAPYDNVRVHHTPDTLGFPDDAPFDRILASASADVLPENLVQQLANDGRLVCPVRNSIVLAQKQNNRLITEEYSGFSFVPLIY